MSCILVIPHFFYNLSNLSNVSNFSNLSNVSNFSNLSNLSNLSQRGLFMAISGHVKGSACFVQLMQPV